MPNKFNIFIESYLKRKSKVLDRIFSANMVGLELISNSLLIECKHWNELQIIIKYLDKFSITLRLFDKSNLKIILPTFDQININRTMIESPNFDQYREILERIYRGGKSMSLVEKESGVILAKSSVSLASPRIILPTGSRGLQRSLKVVGKCAKNTWLNEYWDDRNKYLEKDGKLTNYQYKGYLSVERFGDISDELPALYDLAVDSELINWFDQEAILSTFSYA